MGKYRVPSKKSKYYLPHEQYLAVVHYALSYPALLAEYNTLADTIGAIRYDKDKIQTSNNYDSTFEAAVKLTEISSKLHKIENALELSEANEIIRNRLKEIVCYGKTIYQIVDIDDFKDCGRDRLQALRHKFLYELSKKM